MTTLPRIAARVFNTPLMVAPSKAAAILGSLGGRLTAANLQVLETPVVHIAGERRLRIGTVGDRLGEAFAEAGRDLFYVSDGVAIIRIEGVLVNKGAYVGSASGETSYEGLQAQIRAAGRDPTIRAVVFEVDSFGGEVAGAFETAAMAARLSAIKPTLAILTDYALSAGYLLASAARRIVIPPAGLAGSIGVITMHVDVSQQLADAGVVVTIISSGAHKADGTPTAPLGADVRIRLQMQVDAVRDQFADAVGTYRAGRISRVGALATEALEFRGPEAVAAGLADGVAFGNDALAAFVGSLPGKAATRRRA
jgi:signal peptide peptidase SppA